MEAAGKTVLPLEAREARDRRGIRHRLSQQLGQDAGVVQGVSAGVQRSVRGVELHVQTVPLHVVHMATRVAVPLGDDEVCIR